MKWKIGLASVAVYMLIIVIVSVDRLGGPRNIFSNRGAVRIDVEEEYRIMRLLRKSWYGSDMRFHFNLLLDDGTQITNGSVVSMFLNPRHHFYNPFYTEVVFVHSETEAQGFPDNIVVAWPRDGDWNNNLIEEIHWEVSRAEADLMFHGRLSRPVVTLEEFGLSYPITVADFVDNWKNVASLREALGLSPRGIFLPSLKEPAP